MITCKFGGTSLANAENIRRVIEIIKSNPERRFVVVSAPGKRSSDDVKVTDMLIRFKETGDVKVFEQVEERFNGIAEELGVDIDLSSDYDEMKNEPHNADYIVSCGEYLSARIIAAALDWPFVDTQYCIYFDKHGRLDMKRTERMLKEKLGNLEHAVLPGYYGTMPDGEVRTFSRGGSDISGSLVARAMKAEVYENWTDVSGMLATDPRIVSEAMPISEITYAELEEMAYQGATVLHEEAVRPVWNVDIPIHICNTFDETAAGTWIRSNVPDSGNAVTGISGRKGFSLLKVQKEKMNGMVGYVRRVLSCLEELGIPFDHISTGMSSFCLVVPSVVLEDKKEELIRLIMERVAPDDLSISDGLAMIAVVGRGMVKKPGIAAKLFAALGSIGVNVRVIDMGGSELNIVVGIDEANYEKSVNAIYSSFFQN